MLETEREILKENAGKLANLLTENVPYLLTHYLRNGVLTEGEREDIIQGESSQEIRERLVKTLAAKEGISLDDVIDGLNATENQCVSKEIHNLLSELKHIEEVVIVDNDGSGDKTEDLSAYATNLVDEVIAKAEQRTAEREDEWEEQEPHQPATKEVEDQIPSQEEVVKVETTASVHTSPEDAAENERKEEEEDEGIHDTTPLSSGSDVNEQVAEVADEDELLSTTTRDVPDRGVNFAETVATVIEDGKHNDTILSEDPTSLSTSSASPTRFEDTQQQQNLSDNEEDIDDIDIEKEFVMPVDDNHSPSLSNGKALSNDIIIENKSEEKGESQQQENHGNNNGEANNETDAELAAALARKALVRQQVELFEKKSPGGGKVNYSIRTAAKGGQPKEEAPTDGSNVKNLKNFFQRLSTNGTDNTPAPPSTGSTRTVGKLKVTFPASS